MVHRTVVSFMTPVLHSHIKHRLRVLNNYMDWCIHHQRCLADYETAFNHLGRILATPGTILYVHCKTGKNLSALTVLALLCLQFKVPKERALRVINSRKGRDGWPCAQLHDLGSSNLGAMNWLNKRIDEHMSALHHGDCQPVERQRVQCLAVWIARCHVPIRRFEPSFESSVSNRAFKRHASVAIAAMKTAGYMTSLESMETIHCMECMESMDSMDSMDFLQSMECMVIPWNPWIPKNHGVHGFHGYHAIHGFYGFHGFHDFHGFHVFPQNSWNPWISLIPRNSMDFVESMDGFHGIHGFWFGHVFAMRFESHALFVTFLRFAFSSSDSTFQDFQFIAFRRAFHEIDSNRSFPDSRFNHLRCGSNYCSGWRRIRCKDNHWDLSMYFWALWDWPMSSFLAITLGHALGHV